MIPPAEPGSTPQSVSNSERVATPPPSGSSITVERFPDGLTIQLPPGGIRGARGIFGFAVILNGALAFITAFVSFLFFNDALKHKGPLWILPLFLSFFWFIGGCFLLASLNMARRRAAFAVTHGSLMVIQTGIFGSKQRDFEPGDVEQIRVGPSGMTVNDEPIRELQIIDGGGDKFCLLAGRSEADLYWLAHELSQALNLPEMQPLNEPDESDEEYEEDDEEE